MIVQKFGGGLGNQMFDCAFVKALANRISKDGKPVHIKADLTEYKYYTNKEFPRPYLLKDVFGINFAIAEDKDIPWYYRKGKRYNIKSLWKKRLYTIFVTFFYSFTLHHYRENPFDRYSRFLLDILKFKELPSFMRGILVFNKKIKYCKDRDGYFEGVFCSEKYFIDYESDIREMFSFKKRLNRKSLELKNFIEDNNCVSVHVRRGDYLNGENTSLEGIANLGYYKRAFKKIEELYPNSNFIYIFFSDDIKWCKENFSSKNARFVDWNTGDDSWQDMALMSYCKHNIIPNSTFGWRGAWLNSNKNKTVIAPKIYMSKEPHSADEIIPSSWIKL